MYYACLISFFLFLFSAPKELFCNKIQDDVIVECVEYLQTILAKNPEIIKEQENDKFYLDESRVISIQDGTVHLLTNTRRIPLHSALIFNDLRGKYISISREYLASKMFKFICNSCSH